MLSKYQHFINQVQEDDVLAAVDQLTNPFPHLLQRLPLFFSSHTLTFSLYSFLVICKRVIFCYSGLNYIYFAVVLNQLV